MAWTLYSDVADRWVGNDPIIQNDDLVNALIADAEAIILSKFPKIQDRIDADTLNVAVIKMVVARQVTRVLRNPENLTYLQQTTGPFGAAKNYGSSGNTDIWLTEEEEELLSVKRGRKAFSIDTGANAGIVAVGRMWERDLRNMELSGLPQDEDD